MAAASWSSTPTRPPRRSRATASSSTAFARRRLAGCRPGDARRLGRPGTARRRRRRLLLVERRRVRLAAPRHAARHDRDRRRHRAEPRLPREFEGCYDPSWGRHKARTSPAVGDHEYSTAGGRGYFDYFGAAAGEPGKGWYSYDLGAWHIVVLNSNCEFDRRLRAGLRAVRMAAHDLAATAGSCTAPTGTTRASAPGTHGEQLNGQPFWEVLYEHGAEWVLGGNDHNYERFAPQTPAGRRTATAASASSWSARAARCTTRSAPPLPNTEVQNYGHLRRAEADAARRRATTGTSSPRPARPSPTAARPAAPRSPPPTARHDDRLRAGRTGRATAPPSPSPPTGLADVRVLARRGRLHACSSPKSLTALAVGEHTFRVRAMD